MCCEMCNAEPQNQSDSAGCRYLAIRLGLPVHVQTNLADLSTREAVDQLQPASLAATASNPGSASHHGRHRSDVDTQDFDLVRQPCAGRCSAVKAVSGSAACIQWCSMSCTLRHQALSLTLTCALTTTDLVQHMRRSLMSAPSSACCKPCLPNCKCSTCHEECAARTLSTGAFRQGGCAALRTDHEVMCIQMTPCPEGAGVVPNQWLSP